MKVLLVSSSGGHLLQLHRLEPWWEQHDRLWVTFDLPDSRSLLSDESVVWAYHPTTRNIRNLLKNLALARKVVGRYRPDLIVSTGAAVAFPFFIVGRVLRIPRIYIEVYDRIDSPTLTGRLCHPLSDAFCLQWEDQKQVYPRGEVIGCLF
jgi:beta-1,4-N-acetylglucosaminyltransferase